MGHFYTTIAIDVPDLDMITGALNKLKRTAYISPLSGKFHYIYDEKCEQDEKELMKLCKKLGGSLKCSIFAVMNHDDDILAYWLLIDGKLIDKYNSTPGYFTASRLKPPSIGNPEKICSFFWKPQSVETLTNILSRETIKGNDYFFAFDRHKDICDILGLDLNLQGISFNDIDSGIVESATRFTEIGSGPNAQFRKKLKLWEIKKNELRSENLLLGTIGDNNTPFRTPKWTFGSNPSRLYMAWVSYSGKPDENLSYLQPPWDQNPESHDLKIGPTANKIRFDLAGKYLAVAHAQGNWKLELFDFHNRKRIFEMNRPRHIFDIAFNHDSTLLLSVDSELVITSIADKTVRGKIPLPGNLYGVAAHPTSPYAVVTAAGKIFIVDISEMVVKKELQYTFAYPIYFSDDGNLLFTCTQSGIRVFNWEDVISAEEKAPKPVYAHSCLEYMKIDESDNEKRIWYQNLLPQPTASDVCVDPILKLALYANINGTICYIDLRNGAHGVLLEVPGNPVLYKVALSPDRSVIACRARISAPGVREIYEEIQLWNYQKVDCIPMR